VILNCGGVPEDAFAARTLPGGAVAGSDEVADGFNTFNATLVVVAPWAGVMA
jgi:hypothetical protein